MLIKILGILDLIAGLILVFGPGFNIPTIILILFVIILIVKSSMGGWDDLACLIDFLAGLAFLFLIFINIPAIILIILGILLFQKAVFSFL